MTLHLQIEGIDDPGLPQPSFYGIAKKGKSVASPSWDKPMRPIINRNLSALRRETPEATLEAVLRHLEDVHQTLDFLMARDMQAAKVHQEGYPEHGAACRVLNGQYLRLTSTGVDSIIPVEHDLGRTPQGFIQTSGWDRAIIFIHGDAHVNIPQANKKLVHFLMRDASAGSAVIGVLF